MPSSWSESNRFNSTNRRLDAAEDALLDYETEAIERDAIEAIEDEAMIEAHELSLADDYDEYEAAQLERLDAIRNGDFEDYFQPFGEAHYYERHGGF